MCPENSYTHKLFLLYGHYYSVVKSAKFVVNVQTSYVLQCSIVMYNNETLVCRPYSINFNLKNLQDKEIQETLFVVRVISFDL
jgi:hypothetical protein